MMRCVTSTCVDRSTVHDEMCNFYLMYWVEGDEIMNDNYCVSPGPPSWYWSDVRALHTENIPSDASVVPGTDKVSTQIFIQTVQQS